MDKRTRDVWKSDFKALRTIINGWELIPGAPLNEFDDINHGILSRLYNKSDSVAMVNYILNELHHVYGLYSPDYYNSNLARNEVREFVSEISLWWNEKRSFS